MMLEIGPGRRDSSFSAQDMWIVGLWWIVVGLIAGHEVKRVRSLLKRFADGFDRTHARMLMLVGGPSSLRPRSRCFRSSTRSNADPRSETAVPDRSNRA
jgi:hypothetical protein